MARLAQKVFSCLCILALVQVAITGQIPMANVKPIKLIQVNGTPFNAPIAPEHHEPSGTLLLSVNYPTGNPVVFERVLFNGSHVPFSPLAGLYDEIKMASVRSHHVKSLAQGFKVGDMFTGNGNDGEVLKIETNPDGKDGTIIQTWVKLVAPGGGSVGLLRGGLAFDQTGLWNGDLIITTSIGFVFRVTASGVATYVTRVSGNNLEGAMIIPNNATKFGPMAGTLIAGTTNSDNTFYSIRQDGSFSMYIPYGAAQHSWEDFDVVIPFNNFYGVDYGSNKLLAAKAENWDDMHDELIITEEFLVNDGCPSCLYLFRWDFDASVPTFQCIPLADDSERVLHWEHVTFSSSGINNIPPSFDVCYVGYDNGKDFQARPYPLDVGTLPSVLYGYSTAAPSSPNPYSDLADNVVPKPQNDSVVMYFSMTDTNQLYLTILVDSSNDGSAGELTLSITSPTFPDAQTTVLLGDDPTSSTFADNSDFPDKFNWQDGTGLFQFKWGNNTADGVIIGPMPLFDIPNLERGYCLKPKILSQIGIKNLLVADYFVDASSVFYTTINSEDPEICVYRCDKFCFLFNSCALCNLNSKCNWCGNYTDGQCTDVNSFSAACNATQVQKKCPCEEYAFLGCDTCNTIDGCEWCCAGANSTCASLDDVSTCPGTYINTTCNDLNGCKSADFLTGCINGGKCTCGVCNCPPGLAGDHCELTIDCAGVPGGNGTLNICGLCNSNDTSCIGCDKKPFGINYFDECGVCGGDGSSCFVPCNYTLCTDCIANEACYWCYLDQKCISPLYISRNETCTQKDDQPINGEKACKLPPEAVIGLTAGAIAGIVVAVAVAAGLIAFGAAKGTVDYYRRRNANLAAAVVSPIYNDPVQRGSNVLYEANTNA